MIAKVDHAARRVDLCCIVALIALGFALNQPYLVLFVAVVMSVSTLAPRWGLFRALYLYALCPAGIVRPNIQEDNPLPRQFAQGLGSGVLFLALTALSNGSGVIGWGLALAVAAAALADLLFGFCAGCSLYRQLGRLGIIPVMPERRQGPPE